ncbi:MAG: phosphoribosyltransferase [Flavobacteriales bacterium TMED191]|nr:MAG: phosphoribosyltransferase [Flavobacteriales bacterium TMED191]|tara:strand:+ start:3010 stop:3498 length:489 start_codon:yes stop_codon:yes gene_type:complete
MTKKQIILNKERIANTINRIAFSIIEDYHEEKSITLIGFDKNGYIIAKKIKKITESNNISTIIHRIKKDKKNHFTITPQLSSDNLKNVFLVDDVLKSGRTIIYGIKEILKNDIINLKTIILVNRNHNRFPIGVDYVGLNLSTTLKDHITVIMEEGEEIAYLT